MVRAPALEVVGIRHRLSRSSLHHPWWKGLSRRTVLPCLYCEQSGCISLGVQSGALEGCLSVGKQSRAYPMEKMCRQPQPFPTYSVTSSLVAVASS